MIDPEIFFMNHLTLLLFKRERDCYFVFVFLCFYSTILSPCALIDVPCLASSCILAFFIPAFANCVGRKLFAPTLPTAALKLPFITACTFHVQYQHTRGWSQLSSQIPISITLKWLQLPLWSWKMPGFSSQYSFHCNYAVITHMKQSKTKRNVRVAQLSAKLTVAQLRHLGWLAKWVVNAFIFRVKTSRKHKIFEGTLLIHAGTAKWHR